MKAGAKKKAADDRGENEAHADDDEAGDSHHDLRGGGLNLPLVTAASDKAKTAGNELPERIETGDDGDEADDGGDKIAGVSYSTNDGLGRVDGADDALGD